jgi:NADPH-dependent ferric siderophore reductase
VNSVEMRVFCATVVEVVDLSPAMRRVVLGGPGLAGFETTGVGDEYVRLLFPDDPDGAPVLPPVVDGNLDYGAVDLDRLRTYTVRDHEADAGTVTIDLVVHEGGVAAQWARQARVGQQVGINSPTGMYDPPAAATWQLLVADHAALPAALRIIETTPYLRTRLVAEVAEESHRLPLPVHPDLEVTWLTGGNGASPSCLDDVVRAAGRPDGEGYVWVAGESKTLRAVRKHLRRELGLPATAYKSVGYWIEDAERWRERYAALDDATRSSLEGIWASGRDEEEIVDEYDERLTALGL